MATISGKYATIRYTREDIKSNAIPDFSGWMEQLRNFELNDRVVVNGDYGGREFHNAPGMVFQKDTCLFIGIEFDSEMDGHSGHGKGKDGYCWYVPAKMCKHEENPTQREEVMTTATGERATVLMGVDSEYGETLTAPSARPLELGDTVFVNGTYNDREFDNARGRIISDRYKDTGIWGIEFEHHMGGHHCDHLGRDGHCWYVSAEMCVLATERELTGQEKPLWTSAETAPSETPQRSLVLGDTVFVNGTYSDKEFDNARGRIISDQHFQRKNEWGVEFEYDIDGHSCGDRGRPDHCWYVPAEMCVLESTTPERSPMQDFVIGNRVIINGRDGNKLFENESGTVIDTTTYIEGQRLGIEFDREIPGFHDADGAGRNNRCWYVQKEICSHPGGQPGQPETVFGLGDRVIIPEGSGTKIPPMSEGKIVDINNWEEQLGIEFDTHIYGHTCDGTGRNGHCWYVDTIKCEPTIDWTVKPKDTGRDKIKVGSRVVITEFSGLNWRKAEHLIKDRVFTSQDGSDWSPDRWTLERISQLPKTKFRYICSNNNRIREFSYIKK
jgi:hypothetical protein